MLYLYFKQVHTVAMNSIIGWVSAKYSISTTTVINSINWCYSKKKHVQVSLRHFSGKVKVNTIVGFSRRIICKTNWYTSCLQDNTLLWHYRCLLPQQSHFLFALHRFSGLTISTGKLWGWKGSNIENVTGDSHKISMKATIGNKSIS